MSQTTIIAGRYEIVRTLGGGGMGQVFLAHDPQFPRHVALKLLQTNLAADPALRQRFQREAQTIANLEHHAIVPVYDYGQHEGRMFLVMRLMRGGTLEQKLARGRLPLDEVQTILTRIASALDKAHEQQTIHRDLKPANILFDDEGKAYLSDFGIVKRAGAPSLTATHGIIGTPQYMSPEQAMGDEAIDARSDIYSLGVLAYAMLCGAPPFVGDTAIRTMMLHINEPVPSLAAVRPDLPPQLDAVLARAMAKDPQARFPTAGQFVSALVDALHAPIAASRAHTVYDPSLAPPQKKTRSPWPFLAGGALLLLIAACIVGFLLRPDRQDPAVAADDPLSTGASQTAEVAAIVGPPPTRPSATPTAPPATPTVLTSTPTATATATLTPSPEPTVTATPSPQLPPAITGDDGVQMRLVPAGVFLMGSTQQGVDNAVRLCRDSGANDPCSPGEFSNEMPEHAVTLDAFYMDVTEITNAQYRACVVAGDCAAPANQQYYGASRYDDFPVVHVSWYDANSYCQAMGERLPTEAEWEKAARGDDARLFPWGPAWDATRANTEERGGDRLQPVGQYPSGASPYGILDLSGSVWEWVSDWFDPAYYAISPAENPAGPAAGADKILRGGSFSNHVHYARATNRGFEAPNTASTYRGFRCVISAAGVP